MVRDGCGNIVLLLTVLSNIARDVSYESSNYLCRSSSQVEPYRVASFVLHYAFVRRIVHEENLRDVGDLSEHPRRVILRNVPVLKHWSLGYHAGTKALMTALHEVMSDVGAIHALTAHFITFIENRLLRL